VLGRSANWLEQARLVAEGDKESLVIFFSGYYQFSKVYSERKPIVISEIVE